jgi:hypothetical protein
MIRKLLKNYRVIFFVLYFTLKYNILKLLSTNKGFLKSISCNQSSWKLADPGDEKLRQRIINQVLTVNRITGINNNCLIRSLVIRDILAKYGHATSIMLGVRVLNDSLEAHAWIANKKQNEFKIVYSIL